jgi:hypothetical protein
MALGFMRRHKRYLYVFLWLVVLAFIVLYIPAFQDVDAGSPAEPVAVVGGCPSPPPSSSGPTWAPASATSR